MTQVITDTSSASDHPQRRARAAWGMVLGMGLAFPAGWLLSHASFLVALLGLFFFILFGLVIGAALYRVWRPLRPMARGTIRLGVTLVVLVGWGGSLVWEGIIFPSAVANDAIKQVVKIEGKTGGDVLADAVRDTRAFLAERYPPGGVVGYWQWAIAGDTVEIPITGVDKPKPITHKSTGWFFVVRALLAGLLWTLAVRSQVSPLAKPVPVELSAQEEPDESDTATQATPG
ncbi:MAG: hypothetical protein GY842_07230 [bacterium]|nr:hypothetical protein [bacterium]